MRSAARGFILALLCIFLNSVGFVAHADTASDKRAALQQQLDAIEAEIKQNQTQLASQQQQRASFERDVSVLDSKIKAAQLAIKQRDLVIQQIRTGIADKERAIGVLDGKVADGQDSLAQILRHTREIDDTSLVEVALGGSLSDVFEEVDRFESVQEALGDSFTQMATARSDLSARKSALQDQQQEEQDLRQLQVLQQQSLKTTQKQKQDLVNAAKGQEAIYQQVIANKQQSAAQIKAALFALNGSNQSTSFGQMYEYAKEASKLTGVRPALILGILSEESNLGENVGTGNWLVDMHPTRDRPVFQQICAELGIDPGTQPVSKKPWYGWGGAMGPAQFIPSTWVLYKDRIAKATGEVPPNPWSPRTAAFATAILMMDNGADRGGYTNERLAALRYLAGWKNATKSAYAFYGDDVMELAAKFQSQIDILGG